MRRRLSFCAKNRDQAKAKALNPQESAKALVRSMVTMSGIVSDSAKRHKKDGAEYQIAHGGHVPSVLISLVGISFPSLGFLMTEITRTDEPRQSAK
jgi:hypothetical protein